MQIPVVKNTVTNYISMFVKLIQGILITRYLIGHLGQEFYGLWVLLWSFFCYSVLLDFGLGVAAQKATATNLYKNDIKKYNQTISTIMFFHILMTILILAFTIVGASFTDVLLSLGDASPEKLAYCKKAFLLFGIGASLVFPFGVFSEILVGLQKIYIRNWITIMSKVVELLGFIVIFICGGDLLLLIIYTMVLAGLTQLVMYPFIKKAVPQINFCTLPNRAIFKEIFHFSAYVYISSIARLVGEKGSILVISMMLGLDALSIFQLGGRVPGLMHQIASQYQENISPMVATLHSEQKYHILSDLLVKSMRWNSFIATGLLVGVAIFAQEVNQFLFDIDDIEINKICQILAVSTYVGVVLHSIPERYFLMTGKHKFISILLLVESIIPIVLSLIFLQKYGVIMVAYISLAVKLLAIVLVLFPKLYKDIKIDMWKFTSQVIIRPLVAVVPLVILCLILKNYSANLSNIVVIVIALILGILTYLPLCYLLVLDGNERKSIKKRLKI